MSINGRKAARCIHARNDVGTRVERGGITPSEGSRSQRTTYDPIRPLRRSAAGKSVYRGSRSRDTWGAVGAGPEGGGGSQVRADDNAFKWTRVMGAPVCDCTRSADCALPTRELQSTCELQPRARRQGANVWR